LSFWVVNQLVSSGRAFVAAAAAGCVLLQWPADRFCPFPGDFAAIVALTVAQIWDGLEKGKRGHMIGHQEGKGGCVRAAFRKERGLCSDSFQEEKVPVFNLLSGGKGCLCLSSHQEDEKACVCQHRPVQWFNC
jgi:hypothetical protein